MNLTLCTMSVQRFACVRERQAQALYPSAPEQKAGHAGDSHEKQLSMTHQPKELMRLLSNGDESDVGLAHNPIGVQEVGGGGYVLDVIIAHHGAQMEAQPIQGQNQCILDIHDSIIWAWDCSVHLV